MKYRKLGKTGFEVSEISLGTWQLGGKWGSRFDSENADNILHTAVDSGVNFIDTADVYSDGESEKAIGRFLKANKGRLYVATKCGRKLNPHVNKAYQPNVLRAFIEDSLRNLQLETLDLIQLHCPPWEVYYRPEIFEFFDKLKSEGKILNLGVSVEKVEEALKAIEYENVTSVQIIFNIFRQRPAELFFKEAVKKNVGIIVRVPLASGLLTGKFTGKSEFENGDHRKFNRNGEVFDKGETFSGVNFKKGLEAVELLKRIFPDQNNLAPVSLKWILGFDEISCIIPGASRPEQVKMNNEALELPALRQTQLRDIYHIYKEKIKQDVHHLW